MTATNCDISATLRNKETAMRASFMAIRDVTDHGPTHSDEGDADWIELLRDSNARHRRPGNLVGQRCRTRHHQKGDAQYAL